MKNQPVIASHSLPCARILVLLTILAFILSACAAPSATPVAVMDAFSSGAQPTADPNGGMPVLPRNISLQEAKELYDNGAFVLDVREVSEWDAGHIPGAVLAPLSELEKHLAGVPKDRPVIVICRSGNRSQAGRDILREHGFTNAASVNGGMNDWIANGYPVITGK